MSASIILKSYAYFGSLYTDTTSYLDEIELEIEKALVAIRTRPMIKRLEQADNSPIVQTEKSFILPRI